MRSKKQMPALVAACVITAHFGPLLCGGTVTELFIEDAERAAKVARLVHSDDAIIELDHAGGSLIVRAGNLSAEYRIWSTIVKEAEDGKHPIYYIVTNGGKAEQRWELDYSVSADGGWRVRKVNGAEQELKSFGINNPAEIIELLSLRPYTIDSAAVRFVTTADTTLGAETMAALKTPPVRVAANWDTKTITDVLHLDKAHAPLVIVLGQQDARAVHNVQETVKMIGGTVVNEGCDLFNHLTDPEIAGMIKLFQQGSDLLKLKEWFAQHGTLTNRDPTANEREGSQHLIHCVLEIMAHREKEYENDDAQRSPQLIPLEIAMDETPLGKFFRLKTEFEASTRPAIPLQGRGVLLTVAQ